jgi:signal transduction histidine kinase
MHSPVAMTQKQRARFDALRRKIFGEMATASAKLRVYWAIPFNLLVLLVLVARGEPPVRAAIQCISTLVLLSVFIRSAMTTGPDKFTPISSFVAALATMTAIANTGGCASPLVMAIVPTVAGVSVTFESRRLKGCVVSFISACFVFFAILSHTKIGEFAPPLAPEMRWSSTEYVILSTATILYSLSVISMMGHGFTLAYERVAYELAARREELCHESEDRTLALEGIAARLAHEVKNPLAAIKGLSAHMARSAGDPKVAERLSIVATEADRLQAIVDGFLSFSRGLDDLKVAPVKPHEIARELSLLLETRANEMGVALEIAGDADLSVNADGRKLRQALLNLVLMQASSQSAIVRVDVSRACGDGARIKVIDEGAGMTADILERIRKPYFTTREGGSGLGVAVARGLIEQHGGSLSFKSVPSRGTTVTIELPSTCSLLSRANALPNPLRTSNSSDPQASGDGTVVVSSR